jgi:hypothetical protein
MTSRTSIQQTLVVGLTTGCEWVGHFYVALLRQEDHAGFQRIVPDSFLLQMA